MSLNTCVLAKPISGVHGPQDLVAAAAEEEEEEGEGDEAARGGGAEGEGGAVGAGPSSASAAAAAASGSGGGRAAKRKKLYAEHLLYGCGGWLLYEWAAGCAMTAVHVLAVGLVCDDTSVCSQAMPARHCPYSELMAGIKAGRFHQVRVYMRVRACARACACAFLVFRIHCATAGLRHPAQPRPHAQPPGHCIRVCTNRARCVSAVSTPLRAGWPVRAWARTSCSAAEPT